MHLEPPLSWSIMVPSRRPRKEKGMKSGNHKELHRDPDTKHGNHRHWNRRQTKRDRPPKID